ncbi:MAG: helix-turn-helix domain-containing protein [Enterococcus sp.]
MNIGEILKQGRKNKNMTQEEVAKKSFVTRQTISRWEQNKNLPNIYTVQKLYELYDLSGIPHLIFENGENNKEKEKMAKINWFALIGVVFFNLILFLGIAITAIALLASLWILTIAFTVSPLLFIGVTLFKLQAFTFSMLGLSFLLMIIGLVLIPVSKKATKYLFDFFVAYVKYNKKTIYHV